MNRVTQEEIYQLACRADATGDDRLAVWLFAIATHWEDSTMSTREGWRFNPPKDWLVSKANQAATALSQKFLTNA